MSAPVQPRPRSAPSAGSPELERPAVPAGSPANGRDRWSRRLRALAGWAPDRTDPAGTAPWRWRVDEAVYFRGRGHVAGWATDGTGPLVEAALIDPSGAVLGRTAGVDSPDLAGELGPAAARCRFNLDVTVGGPEAVRDATLHVRSAGGGTHRVSGLVDPAMDADPYHRLFRRFLDELRARPAGRVMELGSRNRSGNVRRPLVAPHDYVGVDIVAGENVDLVADAHDLAGAVGSDRFDAVLSLSTFEHLAMPWQVVVELNRVLRPGGLVFVSSHQAYPVHDAPWDYWRFSEQAWRSLFHPATGFEVLASVMGEPASIVPHLLNPTTTTLERQPAYLGSAVLARKVAGTHLRWDVPVGDALADTAYPG